MISYFPNHEIAVASLKKQTLLWLCSISSLILLLAIILPFNRFSIIFSGSSNALVQGLIFWERYRKLSRDNSLLDGYYIGLDNENLHFPNMDSPNESPENPTSNTKVKLFPLSEIESLKISFGVFVLTQKAGWKNKFRFPSNYFSKEDQQEILDISKHQPHGV